MRNANILVVDDRLDFVQASVSELVDKEFLSEVDVHSIALDLASRIAAVISPIGPDEEEVRLVLVNFLDPVSVKPEGIASVDPLLLQFIEKVHSRLAFYFSTDGEIRQILDRVEVNVVQKVHAEREGGCKSFFLDSRRTIDKPDALVRQPNKIENMRAVRRLYDLTERSPYLAYSITSRGLDQYSKVHEVHDYLDIVTLDKLIADRNSGVSLGKIIQYVIDAMKGSLFLFERGLALTDNNPSNIAVDLVADRALLFDMDGLVSTEDEISYYMTKYGYIPPERLVLDMPSIEDMVTHYDVPSGPVMGKDKRTISDRELVFEFGRCIEGARYSRWRDQDYDKIKMATDGCVASMVQMDPEKRISLKEAVSMLESIVVDFVRGEMEAAA